MKVRCAAYVNNSVCYQLIALHMAMYQFTELVLVFVVVVFYGQCHDFVLDVDNVQRREYVTFYGV